MWYALRTVYFRYFSEGVMKEWNRRVETRRPAILIVLLLLVGVYASGCFLHRRPYFAQPAPEEAMYLHVHSLNNLDVAIYIVSGRNWVRVGTVTAFGEATIRLTPALTDFRNVRVGLDPIGSRRRYLLQTGTLFPGQTLELSVQNNLAQSFWRITENR
jgi:hypothetical protein